VGSQATIAVPVPIDDEFEEFLPRTQEVLDTVEWEGG
jgi:hypothetical protein